MYVIQVSFRTARTDFETTVDNIQTLLFNAGEVWGNIYRSSDKAQRNVSLMELFPLVDTLLHEMHTSNQRAILCGKLAQTVAERSLLCDIRQKAHHVCRDVRTLHACLFAWKDVPGIGFDIPYMKLYGYNLNSL